MKKKKKDYKRLNLYMDRDLFNIIENKAGNDYLPVSTWVKRFLHKNLFKNNTISNTLTNETK